MVQFLRSKISNNFGQKVEINLDDILGIGGESLVVRRFHGQDYKAFKIIPLDGESAQTKNQILEFQRKMNFNITEDQFSTSASEANNSEILSGRAEYDYGSIRHENIMNYENVTMDLTDGHVCLIAGNFLFRPFLPKIVTLFSKKNFKKV